MHRTKFKYENKQRAITKNLSKQELRFINIALPLDEIYSLTKFHNHSIVLEICSGRNSSMNYKRAKAQNLDKQELRFMCTALPLDEIYPPTKFHNHSKYSFGDMHRTKFKYESKQRAITHKLSRQELWFLYTAPLPS